MVTEDKPASEVEIRRQAKLYLNTNSRLLDYPNQLVTLVAKKFKQEVNFSTVGQVPTDGVTVRYLRIISEIIQEVRCGL